MKAQNTIETAIGILTLEEENQHLIACRFGSFLPFDQNHQTPLLLEAQKQLEEYFCGQRKSFNLPLAPQGTPFQQKVWQELQKIPYGNTTTYQDIAERINSPKAYRAVGMANHLNPIAIIIPCHRIIGKNGQLTGYAGGLPLKQKLLTLEEKYR